MIQPTIEQYDEAMRSFENYVSALEKFSDAMRAVGIQTRNVDPFPNYAEVIVSRIKSGLIQPATNTGYDILTQDGIKIQVKSLRVTSTKPGDNGIGWLPCTRVGGTLSGPLIDANVLAIVVYVDFRPYALVEFPIEKRDSFPLLNVTVIGFSHVQRLINGVSRLAGTGVSVVDLSRTLSLGESR